MEYDVLYGTLNDGLYIKLVTELSMNITLKHTLVWLVWSGVILLAKIVWKQFLYQLTGGGTTASDSAKPSVMALSVVVYRKVFFFLLICGKEKKKK